MVTRQRPQLDADTIVDAMLRLAREGGAEALSVRRLGKELGADPTAIYRHFRDKDELMRGAIDRLIVDSLAKVDMSRPWRERLSTLAESSITVMCEHPAVGAEAAVLSTGGDGEAAAIALILDAMIEAGLSDDESVRFYAVFSSYIIAVSAAQCASLVSSPGAYDDGHWLLLSTATRRDRQPTIARVRDRLEELRDREIYSTGIAVILDAVEAKAAEQPSKRAPR